MKLLGRILTVAAGLGAAIGVASWAKKNVSVSVRKMTEEEKAEEEAEKAEAQAETEAAVEAAGDDVVQAYIARAKGWLRSHFYVKVTRGEEAETSDELPEEELEEGEERVYVPLTEDDGPNPNPVEAPASEPVRDQEGRLDATTLASPEDFANWDDLGCQG